MRITVRNAVQGCVMLILGGIGFLFAYLTLSLLLVKLDARKVCGVDVTSLCWEFGASHDSCDWLLSHMGRPFGVEEQVEREILLVHITRSIEQPCEENRPDSRLLFGCWTIFDVDEIGK